MSEIFARLLHFFLWHDKSEVQRHLVEEGDIRFTKRELNRVRIDGFDPLDGSGFSSDEILSALDARKEPCSRAAGLGIEHTRQAVNHIVRGELATITKLHSLAKLE